MVNKNKPSCFISYCRDGADSDSVKHLVQQLNDASEGKIDFLFYEDLTPGSDLPKFMELVKTVNGVIILLTPQYKTRVEERKAGVYKEFSEIMLRYNVEVKNANKKVTNNKEQSYLFKSPFCLVPIIFSSTFEKSYPQEISGILGIDFSEYRAHKRKNGNLYVTGDIKRKYKDRIKKIVSEVSSHYIESTDEFRVTFEEILKNFFKTTKHEDIKDNPRLDKLVSTTFVETYSFKKVKSQSSYLLIGRKGSGKSTITHHLAMSTSTEAEYKQHININVDNFELEYLYSFIHGTQNEQEQSLTINKIHTFEIAWEMFLYLCCMDVILAEYQQKNYRNLQ